MWDEEAKAPKMPLGSSGFRWGSTKGKWNLKLEDGQDGSEIKPQLSFLDDSDAVVQVEFDDFGAGSVCTRGVPVKTLKTVDGEEVQVTTAYDLLMAQYGVNRGLETQHPCAGECRPSVDQFTRIRIFSSFRLTSLKRRVPRGFLRQCEREVTLPGLDESRIGRIAPASSPTQYNGRRLAI
ncbi:MAG: hypothetical protein ABI619_14290 [Betaproteobacteria bacterium]